MKLTNSQFIAVAYIFEIDNGNSRLDYREKAISESGLNKLTAVDLERIIVDGLNNGIYNDNPDRNTAYWALGKRFKKELLPTFRKWLRKELESSNSNGVYQLLIALDNLGEPVFDPDRNGGVAEHETDLNLRDAKKYLKTL